MVTRCRLWLKEEFGGKEWPSGRMMSGGERLSSRR